MASHGVDLVWKDLKVLAPLSKTEKKERKKVGQSLDPKVILEPTSGEFKAGTFTSILGPSGSGKTTLLNFLSNRTFYMKSLEVSGSIYINGTPRSEVDFNSITGYVMQDDVILESFTVREALEFTAKLRLPEDKWESRVKQVISDLELHNCENSYVGGVFRKGISGGEKKRVSIAIELLTDPTVLFLDEPTTGLDSYNAELLVAKLKELAQNSGVTVIATIHQPNSFIFSQFDKLILLAGQTILFHGDAHDALDHFANVGYPNPQFSNPAEHFLKIMSPTDNKFLERIEVLKNAAIKEQATIEQKPLPETIKPKEAGFFLEFKQLGKRSLTNFIRNKILFLAKLAANICFVLVVYMAFWQIGDDTDSTSVTDRAGVIFFVFVYIAFLAVNASGAYAEEKLMFIREQASKTYSPLAYYLSKIVFELPIDLIVSAIVAVLVYAGAGLSFENSDQIFIFILITMVVNFSARGWGNFLIITIPNLQAAIAAAPFFLIVQLLFAGFFVNFDKIPVYLIWLEHLSIFKYSWSAAMQNEFDTWDESQCSESTPSPYCDPIDFYNITISMWTNILILTCLAVGVHILSYLSLYRLARKFRN